MLFDNFKLFIKLPPYMFDSLLWPSEYHFIAFRILLFTPTHMQQYVKLNSTDLVLYQTFFWGSPFVLSCISLALLFDGFLICALFMYLTYFPSSTALSIEYS